MSTFARRLGGYIVATAMLVALWQLGSLVVGEEAFPGPALAIGDFVRLFGSDIAPHLGVSAWRVLASMALGTALAAPLGLVIGRSPRLDTVAAPLLYLTYPVPKVVFLPVLLVLLGIGDAPKIALITIIVFFQILVTARDAARGIPASAVLSVRSLGATRTQVFRHVTVPAALPEIFTALRISVGTAIAVLFFSETIAGTDGLGYYIIDAWGRISYSEMFAGIIAMALLGVILYEIAEYAERHICRWTRAGR